MPLPTPAIADAPRIIEYAPNNAAGPFPVPFPLFDGTGADLAVTLNGALVTNWTFVGEMVPDFYGSAACWVNGMVTFDAPVTGALVIAGRRRPRRVDQFAEGRGVPARDHNLEYNRLTAAQREIFDRTETIAAATADIIPEVTALKDQAQQAATDAGNAAGAAEDAAEAAQQAAQLLTTQALPDGTDFNSLDQRGTYVFTGELNAPLAGPTNRWIVDVVDDPVDADRVAQRASLLVGGTKLELANRRRLAGGEWQPWLIGAAQASDVGWDNEDWFSDKTNVEDVIVTIGEWLYALDRGVGDIYPVTRTTLRDNELKANGALLSRASYPELWAHAQSSGLLVTEANWSSNNQGSFSSGDGLTTFRIPDLRGEFLRGWDDGRGVDSGRVAGSAQGFAIQAHTHTGAIQGGSAGPFSGGPSGGGLSAPTGSTGGSETRPRNIALMYVIRFR